VISSGRRVGQKLVPKLGIRVKPHKPKKEEITDLMYAEELAPYFTCDSSRNAMIRFSSSRTASDLSCSSAAFHTSSLNCGLIPPQYRQEERGGDEAHPTPNGGTLWIWLTLSSDSRSISGVLKQIDPSVSRDAFQMRSCTMQIIGVIIRDVDCGAKFDNLVRSAQLFVLERTDSIRLSRPVSGYSKIGHGPTYSRTWAADQAIPATDYPRSGTPDAYQQHSRPAA